MKKSDNSGIKSKVVLFTICVLFVTLFMAIFGVTKGYYFDTNDDRFISQILSGGFTGEAEYNTVYVLPLLGVLVSGLFKINNLVPWWGLFLITVLFISISLIVYSFFRYLLLFSGDKKPDKKRFIILLLSTVFLLLSVFVSLQKIIYVTQYTSVAMIAAISGFVCIIMAKDSKFLYSCFFVMELLSLCIRFNGMLIVQPIGLSVLLMTCLIDKKNMRKLFWTCIFYLEIIAIVLISNLFLGQMSDEWKKFELFNETRSQLYDYEYHPNYSDVKDILEKYDVKEEQWKDFQNYNLMDFPNNPSLNKELSEFVYSRKGEATVSAIITGIYHNSIRRSIYIPIAFLWIITFGMTLFEKKTKMIIPLVALFLARNVCWTYIVLGGRIVERVSLPLFLAEGIMLLIIFVRTMADTETEKKDRIYNIFQIFIGMISMFVLVLSLVVGYKDNRYVGDFINGQKILMMTRNEIVNYCNAHTENVYLVDLECVSYASGGVFDKEIPAGVNMRLCGGWYTATPIYKKSFNEYIKTDKDKYYLCYYLPDSYSGQQTLDYLKRKMNVESQLYEELTLSSGGVYQVYRLIER